jgi:hypothetical protein
MRFDLPECPEALSRDVYKKIVQCVEAGSPETCAKRASLAADLLRSLGACSTYAECRTLITAFCRLHAAKCPGDEIEVVDLERFGSLRSLQKFVEVVASAPDKPDAQVTVFRMMQIVTTLATGEVGSDAWEEARAEFEAIADDRLEMPVISPYPLWLMRRRDVVPDLFADVRRECLPYWLAVPRASRRGKWLALNIRASAVLPRPTTPTFLDGMSMEEDVWAPGGYTLPAGPPESACADERFARGIEECVRHLPMPIETIDIDHLYIVDGAD